MNIKKLFFSTREMKEKFKHFRDILYIHKRLTQTWLKRALTIIYGVNSYGQNILFGVALDGKNDIPSNEWIFE